MFLRPINMIKLIKLYRESSDDEPPDVDEGTDEYEESIAAVERLIDLHAEPGCDPQIEDLRRLTRRLALDPSLIWNYQTNEDVDYDDGRFVNIQPAWVEFSAHGKSLTQVYGIGPRYAVWRFDLIGDERWHSESEFDSMPRGGRKFVK